ncbi:BLUF domain-containing protein [Zunongwangia pacifica]|uniref:BLUF domain-containing protein n=1 Tax=Zunongwangia pacifica TaxID=2911062 RepID=A0A9X2CL46_9FLAO|nr:BLUF domain-containing protein [Zunongwangia pacifica]MCL6218100.1 BLUF domain-containing protein [Zunongwangia pacifica]
MKRWAICYVSTASPDMEEKDIDNILSYTENWNMDHNITGILLCSEGNFFQVIEGESAIIQELFANIAKDSRHRNLIKIFNKEIKNTTFTGYEAAFLSKQTKNLTQNISYLEYLKYLYPASQNTVKNMLKAFVD